MKTENVTVIGPGSIGLFLAYRFRAAGARVQLIHRRPSPNSEISLQVETKAGLWQDRVAIRSWEETDRIDPSSLVFVACKASDLESVVPLLAKKTDSENPLVFVQNGIGVYEFAQERLQKRNLIRATVWSGASCQWTGTSVVHLQLYGEGKIEFAPTKKSAKDVEWRKALANIALNAVCALAGVKNGALLESQALWDQACDALAEAVAVANVEGLSFQLDEEKKHLREVLASTASNENSMLRDLRAGKPTEVDWLNGRVVELGRHHGITTPVNQLLTERVRGQPQLRSLHS